MIRHYLIDGNNLMGKIPSIKKLQKKDKQGSRAKLAYRLDSHFSGSKYGVTLHLDGHRGEAIRTINLKIEYSADRTADDMIKDEIARYHNPRLLAVVTSDFNLGQFARVNGCKVIRSETFSREMSQKNIGCEEEQRIKDIDNDEMKRLFGVE